MEKNSIQFEPTSCRKIKVCKTEIIKKISTYATKKDIYTTLSENVHFLPIKTCPKLFMINILYMYNVNSQIHTL